MARRISQHDYHRAGTSDAQHQFDAVETTISHLFRFPHPALGGLCFGEALADRLLEEGLAPARHIIEVGGGTGAMAEALWARLRQRLGAAARLLSYTILDLAPRLQAAQRQRLHADRAIALLSGDATRLPLRDGAVEGMVVCNEVIADLDVVQFNLTPATADDALDLECRALVERYRLQLDADAHEAAVNLGAIRFVEEVARVLAPGSAAFISEFGGHEPVRPVLLSDHDGGFGHTEFSIHFGHLQAVASALGLRHRLAPMISFLRMPPAMRVANFNDIGRARVAAPGLDVFAYPIAEFTARVGYMADCFPFTLPALGGAAFPDDNSRSFATSFQCLLLQRPP